MFLREHLSPTRKQLSASLYSERTRSPPVPAQRSPRTPGPAPALERDAHKEGLTETQGLAQRGPPHEASLLSRPFHASWAVLLPPPGHPL